MKRLSMFAVLSCVCAILAPSAMAEGEPAASDAKGAAAVVQRVLIQPLASKESDQSRFSRARMPAQERRVRVLDEQAGTDSAGAAFYTFAVDARHGIAGDAWRRATITGCVYATGEVYVKSGDRYRPAAFLLGKNLKPVDEHFCQAGAAEVAKAQ
jgi:hypothetical protein